VRISATALAATRPSTARWINLSCNLPAGTEISLIGGYYGFENGVPAP
jgi:hypothetical protein